MKEIRCSFCQGKGKDPFDLLSKLANCQVCGGRGNVKIDDSSVVCAFCRGTGVHPNSRLTCSACRGKGSVAHRGEKMECFNCNGTGYKVDGNLPCSVCSGKGVVSSMRKNRG